MISCDHAADSAADYVFLEPVLDPELELVLHYESGLDLQQLHHLEHVEPELDEPVLDFHLDH